MRELKRIVDKIERLRDKWDDNCDKETAVKLKWLLTLLNLKIKSLEEDDDFRRLVYEVNEVAHDE